jgi:acyl carrier protein
MSSATDIEERLKSHILAEYLPGESPANLSNDTPLRTSGILDSIATVKLVSFIETTFNVELEAHETGIQNFDRIADIATLIVRKQAGR